MTESEAKQSTSQVSLSDADALRRKKEAEKKRRYREKRSEAKKDADRKKDKAAKALKNNGMTEEERKKLNERNKVAQLATLPLLLTTMWD